MTAPETAAALFFRACLIGGGLGLIYGFLRPLRPRRTALADTVFVAAALWGWLYLGFGVCRGDLRLSYTGGLFLGGILWDRTAGRLLAPVFSGFWKAIGKICAILTLPLKKILEIAKILFASGEKWVTIKWSNRRHLRRTSGGKPYGRTEKVDQPDSAGLSAHHKSDQDHGDRGHRIVYGRTDLPASFHD